MKKHNFDKSTFIQGYYISKKICDDLIDFFNKHTYRHHVRTKGNGIKKETKNIDSGKDPKGLRGQKGTEYTSQRLASIKSTAEETVFKAISLKLDLMKTTGKNTGDISAPVTQVTNPETGKVEQKKPFPKKEVFTNDQGNNPNQNPLHVQGKGFKGRQMRRKDPETGKMIKVGKETTTTKIMYQSVRINQSQVIRQLNNRRTNV